MKKTALWADLMKVDPCQSAGAKDNRVGGVTRKRRPTGNLIFVPGMNSCEEQIVGRPRVMLGLWMRFKR